MALPADMHEQLERVVEFHFSASGRATSHYGTEGRGADAHIVWRRIGGHDIYREP